MEIKKMEEKKTMCIRATTAVQDLPQVLGQGYGEIMGVVQAQGLQPAGAPYTLYYNDDMSALDIEFGFPVVESGSEKGRVKPGVLPGGKTAAALHIGPYDTIGKTYEELTGFVKENGGDPKGICYEVYIDDPSTTKPEELNTEVVFLLND
ncbi:MAG: GyrI-like domain-containing protein [Spirochaetia bacterium]